MQQQTKKKYQRRHQFLIEKSFQHRVIWRFGTVVIASIFFSHFITVGFLKLKEIFSPSSQDLVYFANTLSPTMVFTRVLDILWLPMLFSALLGSILIVIFSLFYSHRIAGPLYNLKRMMHQIEKGDLNVIMKIRKNDEFHDVEEAFNRMLAGLKSRREDLEKAVANLSGPDKNKIGKILKSPAPKGEEF